MSGLSVSNLVNVTVNLTTPGALGRSFGTLMIAGDSNVINGLERFRSYASIDGVAEDFGVNTPEFQASELYFSQSPTPSSLMIGRWISTATPPLNVGGILSPSQQVIGNFTPITTGDFSININGSNHHYTGLDFSGTTNLNGVATVVNTALSGTATCTWNGSNFTITDATTGAGSNAVGTVHFAANPDFGVQATGTITLSGQPSNGNTVSFNGTVVTFVSSGPIGNQVLIGTDDSATSVNLQTFLAASTDPNLSAATYSTTTLVTTILAKAYGVVGNAYTLTKVGSNIAVSGATLASGVDPDSLTLNGTKISFVNTAPVGNQVQVGPTASNTITNFQNFVFSSSDTNLRQATYSTNAATGVLLTTITAVATGSSGTSYTMTQVSADTAFTLSGATLSYNPINVGYATPGVTEDVSGLLALSASTSQALVPGYNPESPLQCAVTLANVSTAWYGLMFAASVQPTTSQSVAVAGFIEATVGGVSRIFGVSTEDTNTLSDVVSTDVASQLKALGYMQSFVQYSSSSPYAIASLFGRMFTVDYTGNNTTINLMYKQEPGVVAEALTQNQANVLKNKNCNVFVAYVNDTNIIQYGVVSGGEFIDVIQGNNWLQNAVQTACYNVLYTTTTKVPQTDAGVNQLVNAIAGVCNQAVANGLCAPGIWNAAGFGSLQDGQLLKLGYYIYATPVALQAESDRAARKSPPIQVAIKLAGAIQLVNVLINVNQ